MVTTVESGRSVPSQSGAPSARSLAKSVGVHLLALIPLLLIPAQALRSSPSPSELEVVFHRPRPPVEVRPRRMVSGLDGVLLKEHRISEDRVERGAQFMAHIGHELGFGEILLISLFTGALEIADDLARAPGYFAAAAVEQLEIRSELRAAQGSSRIPVETGLIPGFELLDQQLGGFGGDLRQGA